MGALWTSLGDSGHIAIYAAVASILSIVFGSLASKEGIVGKIFTFLKSAVDFLSMNQKH